MIANIKNQSGLKDIKKYLNYCIKPQAKNAERYGEKGTHRVLACSADGLLPTSENVNKWVDDLDEWTKLNRGTKCKNTTYRALTGVISFHKDDHVNSATAINIVKATLNEEMGGSDRFGFFVAHNDSEEGMMHIHFAAASVGADGSYFTGPKGQGELYRQFELAMERVETQHGFKKPLQRYAVDRELKKTSPNNDRRAVNIKADRHSHTQKQRRLNKLNPGLDIKTKEVDLKDTVLFCMHEAKNFPEFMHLCENNGVRIQPNVSGDKITGISFAHKNSPVNHAIKGSDMGDSFKWGKLSKKLHYSQDRDFIHLRGARQICDDLKNGITPKEPTWHGKPVILSPLQKQVEPPKPEPIKQPEPEAVQAVDNNVADHENTDYVDDHENTGGLVEVDMTQDFTADCSPYDQVEPGQRQDNSLTYGS